MSSSTPSSTPQEPDIPMMEVPDSPPEMTQALPSSTNVSFAGSPQAIAMNRANAEAKINHGAPGSTWNTKKFNEEWERAVSSLADRDFDHAKYGDILLKS